MSGLIVVACIIATGCILLMAVLCILIVLGIRGGKL